MELKAKIEGMFSKCGKDFNLSEDEVIKLRSHTDEPSKHNENIKVNKFKFSYNNDQVKRLYEFFFCVIVFC